MDIDGEKEWPVPNQLAAGGVLSSYLRIQEGGEGGVVVVVVVIV